MMANFNTITFDFFQMMNHGQTMFVAGLLLGLVSATVVRLS